MKEYILAKLFGMIPRPWLRIIHQQAFFSLYFRDQNTKNEKP
jgi:hypothetical protein